MVWQDFLPRTAEAAFAFLGAWIGLIWGATLESVAPLVWWFLIFMAVDIVTGIWAALKRREWKSKVLWVGVTRKAISFAVIILAHGIDVSFWYVLNNAPLFQSIALCAYSCGEFGSIVENIERLGYGNSLPPVLRKLFHTIEDRLEHAVDKKLDSLGLGDEDTKEEKKPK